MGYFCLTVKQLVMEWETHCPDAGGRLPVVLVPTPMIKPAAAFVCKGKLSSFLSVW